MSAEKRRPRNLRYHANLHNRVFDHFHDSLGVLRIIGSWLELLHKRHRLTSPCFQNERIDEISSWIGIVVTSEEQ